MHATHIEALPQMTGGTSLCLSVLLLINKFQLRLAGFKNTMCVVKPSYVVQDK